jgi:hypothetical protein
MTEVRRLGRQGPNQVGSADAARNRDACPPHSPHDSGPIWCAYIAACDGLPEGGGSPRQHDELRIDRGDLGRLSHSDPVPRERQDIRLGNCIDRYSQYFYRYRIDRHVRNL